ncbi:hypothetical protein [Bosea sp. OK403]|uniref:hypothetical protein n=1 Tax=Bosea sp. OK403 TaxID=1855286 RepID=UPI000B86DEAC|nr:hypothetical protein [Bosea sp. OK403]
MGEESGDELAHIYELDVTDLASLSALTGFQFPGDIGPVRLRPWHALRNVPYLIHTEFELALMLEGRKPLAVFEDAYPSDWFATMLARFDPFVRDGRFVRRVIDRPLSPPTGTSIDAGVAGMRSVYVALPGQEWRIDAYIEMRQSAGRSGWSEASERRQGKLLGYTDWECDWWAENRPSSLSRRR